MKKLHGWTTATISEVATIGGGTGFPEAYQGNSTGDIPFIKVSDLNSPGNEKYVVTANNWISEEVRKKVKAKIQPPGSIVFAKVGGALLTNKRRILSRPTIIDNNMMSLFATGANPHYLYHVMLGIDLGRYRQEGAVPSVNGGRVGEIILDLPPHPEQRKIADILSTWDEALEKLDALISAKDHRKQALMQHLLTGRRRFPAFGKKAWTKVRMNQLLERVFRPIEWSAEMSLSLISIRRRCGGLFRRPDLLGSEYKTQDLHDLEAGDFLVSKRQVAHGAWAMVTPEFAGGHVSKEYAIFTNIAPAKFHMPFFAWLAQTPRMIRLSRVASTGVHIEKLIFDPDVFLRESIRIPADLAEQRQIAAILDTADQELTLLRTQRNALDQQKRGLMQRLLTGKTRVKL
jgi:type I restriction enzyme S subunit